MAEQMRAGWKLHGKRVTVLGLGREGSAVARYLVQQGAIVTVSDLKSANELCDRLVALADLPLHYFLGDHPEEILEADVMFVSPGIPLDTPIVIEARKRGLPLSSETRLFCRLCPAPVIGVTGSSGKTTTTTLISKMLQNSGKRVHLGGNIGNPLISKLAKPSCNAGLAKPSCNAGLAKPSCSAGATQIEPDDIVVMELSSFQLDFFGPVLDAEPYGELIAPLFPPGGWSPPVAVVLNVTPNHLDRHPTMESYIAAKAKIIRYQRSLDYAVLNWDDSVTRGFAAQCVGRVAFFSLQQPVPEGAYRQGDSLLLRQDGQDIPICSVKELRLRGQHNVANVLAACAVAGLLGASAQEMAEVASSFTGIEHRLELVRELHGVRYYNDSIATSPERAMAALASFSEPIVLLAGGRDKHLPWDDWARLVSQKATQVIVFGEATALLEGVLKRLGHNAPPVQRAESLAHAVQLARAVAQPGQVVLFAPGGVSFDAFRDYEERGHVFKQMVHALC